MTNEIVCTYSSCFGNRHEKNHCRSEEYKYSVDFHCVFSYKSNLWDE